jgi:hypothetical protein
MPFFTHPCFFVNSWEKIAQNDNFPHLFFFLKRVTKASITELNIIKSLQQYYITSKINWMLNHPHLYQMNIQQPILYKYMHLASCMAISM